MRGLAVTTDKRLSVLPELPTARESGLPDFSYDPWFGVLAPAGTPKLTIEKLNADFVATSERPEMRDAFTRLGIDVATSTPEEFDLLLKSDASRFGALFGKPPQQAN